MKLQVGERLEGAGPAHQPGGYVVTSIVRETPWHGLYTGKKIFYNFDFTAKRVRETDEVEWLDVFIRTNRYPILDDPTYVFQRRALARAELRAVLGNRHSNLWPEPLDLLEIENTRDPFAFTEERGQGAEPIVVYTRPHGRFTPEWQQKILPVSSILSVLAELLEFVRQAHAEGLLLLGLGPASLLIDDSDRVHFVGTEMVLTQHSTLLKESTAPLLWQRLFPADRFVRGYSAPECFDPNKRPDVRSDLYSWGTLAYGLLTGADISKLAREQGRPWATFVDAHWTQLENVLAKLPRNNLLVWAEQIGVQPERLLADWPHSFTKAFRLLLSPDPFRRPGSADELLAWLVNPPPPPVAEVIALHTDSDSAKLLLDCTGLDPGMEMQVQCARGTAPRQASDGITVAEGPIRPVVGVHQLPVTMDPIYYTVFTRRRVKDQTAFSPGVAAKLWQPSEANLRRWVEEQAAGAFDSAGIPTRVGMVLGALDPRVAIEGLLASSVPRVRAWGLRRLEQSVRTLGRLDAFESLVWRFLGEANSELRQSAALTLWSFHPQKNDELLLRIIEALEAPPLDVPIPLMHFLRQLQLPEDRIRSVLHQLETKRPTECPLCKKPLTLGERSAHLQAEHGYLIYQGDVMPASAVFARLWERTLEKQDRHAHEEMPALYLHLPEVRKNKDAAVARYVADLQRYLLREDPTAAAQTIPLALSYEAVVAYQECLRGSAWFLPITKRLLASPNRRVRDLGTQAALPFLQEQIRGKPSVEELRRALKLVSEEFDSTDQQIDLCRQLAQHGVEQALVQDCIAQLQEDRLIVCTECKANVRAKDIELHLRRAHQVFQFRGARKTYVETRETILKTICSPPADVAAWRSLESLVADRHPQDTDRYLIGWLYQHLKDGEDRAEAVAGFAETVVGARAVDRLLPVLLAPSKSPPLTLLGQRIALEICGRLTAPLPAKAVPSALPILDQKELPRRTRENAALALMRALGKDSPRANDVLRAYVAQSTKRRGLEKLQQLEQRFGHSPLIDALTNELEDDLRMSCPRCPTELPKKEMVVHLWDKHRLVLDGQRVREPWRVIDDWVVDYGLEKDPQVLQRCRELALKDDPQIGLARLQRLLYRKGLRDRELLFELKSLVKTRKATLCPHCCTSVAIEDPPTVQALTLTESSLQGHGFQLEVSERGLIPQLVVESPDTVHFRDREPGRFVTRLGGIVLVMLPFMLIAAVVLFRLLSGFEQRAILSILLSAGVGLLAAGVAFLLWPTPRPVQQRLVDAAWKLLVPDIVQEDMDRRAWGFLHGLMAISDAQTHKINLDLLLECCEEASVAARTDPVALSCLNVLSRRCIEEMREAGDDPFDFILTLAAECFKGRLPLAFLGDLLRCFHAKERAAWSKADLNRLPILLADRAFAAEMDLDDWFSLGRAFPAAHAVLNLENRWHWLQFHALWTEYQRRPWEAIGPAVGMIDLAKNPRPHQELLSFYPDVLLYVAKANLVIGTKGVWIEGVCVTAYQPGVEVAMRKFGGEYEIVIGDQRIRAPENPSAYLNDIRRWLSWYFHQFVKSVPAAPRPMIESRNRMWQLGKIDCPECAKPLYPCPADLGVALR
ncbi:MAG: hypothetical protein HYX68_18135 [Planctomycetes bacterium]|nr:hypothetical protein [Planctomycetota bacterium]